jgi:hypothetical protein
MTDERGGFYLVALTFEAAKSPGKLRVADWGIVESAPETRRDRRNLSSGENSYFGSLLKHLGN